MTGSSISSHVGAAAVLAAALLASLATSAPAALGDCSQPSTTGDEPKASDCAFILRAAVGVATCSTPCICDTNGIGGVTASDAQVCLRRAVGQDVALACPCEECLLVNGDFSDPVSTSGQNGWTFANISNGGWQPTGGNPGSHFVINQAGQLETDPSVSQSVSGLEVGGGYRISGDFRSFAPGFGDPAFQQAFAVLVSPKPSGQSSVIILAIPRPSPDPLAWTEFSVDFQASGTTAAISFIAERDGDDSSFDVDNLCLTRISQ